MSTNQPRIFISHSHKDDEFGVRLIEDLRRILPEENAVWYDSHGGLVGGAAWWKMIRNEIASRTIFLIVLSPEAVESKWVEDEVDLAWVEKNTRGMRIIPLLHRACTIRSDLRTLQVIDFQASRDYDIAFDELLKAIGVLESQAVYQPANQPKNLLTNFMPKIEASFTKQNWSDVLRKADYLLKHTGEDLPATFYLWQGVAYEKRRRFKDAQGAFEMALVLVEEQSEQLAILKAYTDLLFSQEKWEDAIPLVVEALDLFPNDPGWLEIKQQAQGKGKTQAQWIERGNAFRNLNNYEEALEAYEQVIKMDPNLAFAYYGKGNSLYDLNRYEEALVAYEQAIKLDPIYAIVSLNRGNALSKLKRYEEAHIAYEQAINMGSKTEMLFSPLFDGEELHTLPRTGERFFFCTKSNDVAENYEDAASISGDNARFALSDGVSSNIYVIRPWARLLTSHWVANPLLTDDVTVVENWLQTPRKRWQKWVEQTWLPKINERKRSLGRPEFTMAEVAQYIELGANATFLGVSLDMKALSWKALAVGDTCLFHLFQESNGTWDYISFPLKYSNDFTDAPVSITSSENATPFIANTIRLKKNTYQKGDILLLATDALAEWLFKQLEQQRIGDIMLLLNTLNNELFTRFVNQERRQRRLKDDDTSLIIVRL